MSTKAKRLLEALNSHDAERMAALFADDYASSQPAHPNRTFSGRPQVLKNWTAIFETVPDLIADLVSFSITGNTEWTEWYWRGRHVDGSAYAARGVIILVVREDLIAEGRLYMEPVETSGGDIDASVRELYKRPPAETS
jgi:ketosteroid isomerase-like protein